MENLCRLFFPLDKINVLRDREQATADDRVYTQSIVRGGDTKLIAEINLRSRRARAEREVANTHPDYQKECERQLAKALFLLLCDLCGFTPPWGILTGVRPLGLMRRLIGEFGREGAAEYFNRQLLVSPAKTKLCLETALREADIIKRSTPNAFSLYISIPFCPTRCNYCSFVSHSIANAKKLIEPYVTLLCEELAATAGYAKRCGLSLKTVYIGGGTPTTLSAEQLARIMIAVKEHFDLTGAEEYTVEAGRPDTITREKLDAIKAGGATRISVNPQTMNDNVLERIGRRHTARQAAEAFRLTRQAGFDDINMDLICGLDGDDQPGFERSLCEVLNLNPDSITVHTLCLKRSSQLGTLRTVGDTVPGVPQTTGVTMLQTAIDRLPKSGYQPYYLYRQSKSLDNLENIGFARAGKEGLYNVYIMDETHTILGCGAGAVTKLKQPRGSHIERIFNFKYPYEYINRFSQMQDRKTRISEFYEEYPVNLPKRSC